MLEDKFRALRRAWFMRVIYEGPVEREWRGEAAEQDQVDRNRKARILFDLQTDRIIKGEHLRLDPVTGADIEREIGPKDRA
jgi:hypothetical protein